MQTELKYRYGLDETSKKSNCPYCKKKRFVRMFDFETGEYLPDHVGRCDREGGCGYHYTAKQYLEENGSRFTKPIITQPAIVEPEQVDYMPGKLVLKSMLRTEQSSFGQYLVSLFGEQIAIKVLEKYCVGRSSMDNSKACIFWNVDKDYNIRTGKIIRYNPVTGKRNKEIDPKMVHKQYNKNFKLKLCFFGEHLLAEFPESKVGLVESEKTAIIASIFMPQVVWLATGGASGCKWREYSVFSALKGRDIVMCPDFGYYNRKSKKTCYNEWLERAKAISERMPCTICVNDILETNISEEERLNDYDLADMLIKRDNSKGWALTDALIEGMTGYPVMWDL